MNKNNKVVPNKEMVNGRVVVTNGNGQAWVEVTIGIDLGDRTRRYCLIEKSQAELILVGVVKMRRDAMRKTFDRFPPARVARKLAVLLHRLWVSGEAWEPKRGYAAAGFLARLQDRSEDRTAGARAAPFKV